MTFIRRLVWRETGVTVETIDSILHRYMGDGRVELCDAGNSHRDAFLEVRPYGIIFRTMLLKPRAVVVRRHIF